MARERRGSRGKLGVDPDEGLPWWSRDTLSAEWLPSSSLADLMTLSRRATRSASDSRSGDVDGGGDWRQTQDSPLRWQLRHTADRSHLTFRLLHGSQE